jgi:hypothetical protein
VFFSSVQIIDREGQVVWRYDGSTNQYYRTRPSHSLSLSHTHTLTPSVSLLPCTVNDNSSAQSAANLPAPVIVSSSEARVVFTGQSGSTTSSIQGIYHSCTLETSFVVSE